MFNRKITVRPIATLLVALLGFATIPACTTNPATGKSNLIALSMEREIALGEESKGGFTSENGGPIPSPEILAYVQQIGRSLAASSELPELPWEFEVLDSSVINAFALPGGKVFISRGLLMRLSNEAQLAGVLGHEIGHVTARHIGQQMTQAIGVQAIAIGIGIGASQSDNEWVKVLGQVAPAGGMLYLLRFGRTQELEADSLGVRYMTRLGYNPLGQVQVLQILADESAKHPGGMEMLSTHPDPARRIKDLQKLIDREHPDAASASPETFQAQRYKTSVLDRLSRLPAPKHNPK